MLAISHKLLCIRLSSLLCCEPRLPRTSGEAVTQGGPLPPLRPPRRPSVTSEAADQEGFPLYPSPRLSEELLGLLLLTPPSLPRFRTLSTGERREGGKGEGKYTLSSLPCPHSCIQLHGAALMHFFPIFHIPFFFTRGRVFRFGKSAKERRDRPDFIIN